MRGRGRGREVASALALEIAMYDIGGEGGRGR